MNNMDFFVVIIKNLGVNHISCYMTNISTFHTMCFQKRFIQNKFVKFIIKRIVILNYIFNVFIFLRLI